MDEYMGTIKVFAFPFAPKDWALCNGQIMSIAQNSALFSLLGTTFGGDGIQTFALPNLQGRSIVGLGTGPGLSPIAWGQVAGTETSTITTASMPGHMHPITAPAAVVSCSINALSGGTITNDCDSGSNSFASGGATANIYSEPNVNYTKVGGVTNSVSGATSFAGNNVPVQIRNPYLAINHCILLSGVYPSRD
ncbi:phage tail protein [Flavobacterium sp. KACC 22761]|uniref:phage tail protein n=1 Tax=Flavobacterium sp. KACC 22761 TaxID=3092665 RepID=UPI002A751DE3|nr:tail fiber protein [Flavobacterium sp. KACC 22761]WPO78343.1 tail fiber protein [Flavobacterium sp. KACC 22761]